MSNVENGTALLKCKSSGSAEDLQVIGKLSSCSLERSRELIEVNSLTSDYPEKIAGTKSWSMSADGTIDFANDGQSLLMSSYMQKKVVFVELAVNNVIRFSGDAYIESLSIGVSAGEAATISMSMVGNGILSMVKE